MMFSVVIPTCDRPDLLQLCLDALAADNREGSDYCETIVTDDGKSPVAPLLEAKYPWVKWSRGPRRGPAANRNSGALHAKGDWLVFTDDDCVPRPGWLAHYRDAISSKKDARAFEGAIHPVGDLDKDLAECPVNLFGDCFWSANVCISRELFFALKGFDEAYRIAAHEDQDIYIKLKKRTTVPFVKDAAVEHPVRYGTLTKSLREMKTRCLNWLYFAQTNIHELDYKNKLGIVSAGYGSQVRAAYRALKKGYPKQLLVAVAMLSYGLPFIAVRLASEAASDHPPNV
jgi:GT2 family glycosyltransferase